MIEFTSVQKPVQISRLNARQEMRPAQHFPLIKQQLSHQSTGLPSGTRLLSPEQDSRALKIYFPRLPCYPKHKTARRFTHDVRIALNLVGENSGLDHYGRNPYCYLRLISKLVTFYRAQIAFKTLVVKPSLAAVKNRAQIRGAAAVITNSLFATPYFFKLRQALAHLPGLTWLKLSLGSYSHLSAVNIRPFASLIGVAHNLTQLHLSFKLEIIAPSASAWLISELKANLTKLPKLAVLSLNLQQVNRSENSTAFYPQLVNQCLHLASLTTLSLEILDLPSWPDGLLPALAGLKLMQLNLSLGFTDLTNLKISDFTRYYVPSYSKLRLRLNFMKLARTAYGSNFHVWLSGLGEHLQRVPNLQAFQLSICYLTGLGLHTIVNALASVPSLQKLKLQLMSVDELPALFELSNGLTKLRQLTEFSLDLPGELVTSKWFMALITALGSLTKLTNLTLNLAGGSGRQLVKLNSHNINALGHALLKLPLLSSFRLDLAQHVNVINNGTFAQLMHKDGMLELFPSPHKLTQLTAVTIILHDAADLSEAGLAKLGQALTQIPQLTQVHLELELATAIKSTAKNQFYLALKQLKPYAKVFLRLGKYAPTEEW